MRHPFKRFVCDREGSIIVEFALVAPLLLVVIFGLIELGRLYLIYNNLQYAIHEAGRYAMINTSADATAISQHVATTLMVDPDDVVFTVQDQTINGKVFRNISLAYNFSPMASNLVNLSSFQMSSQTTVPILP